MYKSTLKRAAAILILATAILVLICSPRYSSPQSGPPCYNADCGNHIAITNLILRGLIFPELKNSAQYGRYFFDRYAVIYKGMLGSHVLAIAAHFFNLSIPGSMLSILDLSLLAILFIFNMLTRSYDKKYRIAGWIFFILIGLPAYAAFCNLGFYSFTVSVPFVMAGLYFLTKSTARFRWELAFFSAVCGMFCHASFIIWFAPAAILLMSRGRGEKAFSKRKVILTLFYLGLLAPVVYKYIVKIGDAGVLELPASIFLLFLAIQIFLRERTKWKDLTAIDQICRVYAIGVVISSILSLEIASEIDYQTKKMVFWTAILLPMQIPNLYFKHVRGSVFTAFVTVGLFIFAQRHYSFGIKEYIAGTGGFTASQENEILMLRDHRPCRDLIFLPRRFSAIDLGQFTAQNSYFQGLNQDHYSIATESIHEFKYDLFIKESADKAKLKADFAEVLERACFYSENEAGRFVPASL
jgi:hypothetical protein